MRFKILLLCGSLLCAPVAFAVPTATSSASADASRSTKVPDDPELRRGVLPNGFSYYIRKLSSPDKQIAIRMVVKAGFNHEDPDQIEYAHLVEHLVANHVADPNLGSIWDWVPSWGGRIGADFNASTHDDRTVYKLSVPVGRPELFDQVLRIQRGWAQGAQLGEDGTARERKAVIAEIMRSQDPPMLTADRIVPILTDGQQRFYATTETRKANAEQEDGEPVVRFYRDWYRPDAQALFIVGDVDPDIVEAKVRKTFSDMKPIQNPRSTKVPELALGGERPFRKLSLPSTKELQFHLYEKRRDYPPTDAEGLKDEIIAKLIDVMVAPREIQLRNHDDSAIMLSANAPDLSSSAVPLGGNTKMFRSIYRAQPARLHQVIDEAFSVRNAITAFGFSETELDDAKVSVLKDLQLAADNYAQSSISMVDYLIDNFVQGRPIPAPAAGMELNKTLMAGITVAEVNQRARNWMSSGDRDILITGSPSQIAALPDDSLIESWIATASGQVPRAAAPLTPLGSINFELDVPAYGGTVETSYFADYDVTRLVIPENGITVLLKPDKSTGPDPASGMILVSAWSPFGRQQYSGNDYLAAQVAGPIGWGGQKRELSDVDLERLSARSFWVAPDIADDYTEFTGGALRPDFELLMKLFYQQFTASVDRKEQPVQRVIESRRAFTTDPKNVFAQAVTRAITLGGETKTILSAANIDQLDPDRAIEIYRDRFRNPGDFLFVVSGRFEPADITPLLTKYLAPLKVSAQRNLLNAPQKPILRPGSASIDLPGEGDNIIVTMMYVGKLAKGPRGEVTARAFDRILGARLRDRLREKERGTYAVGESTAVLGFADEARTTITFETSKANVERLTTAALEEIDRLKREGPTVAEMAAARELEDSYRRDRGKRDIWYWTNFLGKRFLSEKGRDIAYMRQDEPYASVEDIRDFSVSMLRNSELKRFTMPTAPITEQ